jgi:tryptophanyl-tRNA synthetase
LGNYVGAIRPAIAASKDENVAPFYFLADYHALIKCEAAHSALYLEITPVGSLRLDPERYLSPIGYS